MRNRIDILKDIMTIEKHYALEEIDSEEFESKLTILEQQLKNTSEISEEELKQAIDAKEIPLSANQLIGRVSIDELLPNYNVPRTFLRHLKIQREIKELERNIGKLKHDIQKIKVLMAEKKVNHDQALLKIETLEFDLRLAQNRYGAREKYLKRNPTKGDLTKFTLSNFLNFSFGHGVSNEAELLQVSEDLKSEIVIRQNYRDALAELLATIKTTQINIRATSKMDSLPDFKKLRDLQQTINELQDYIKLLNKDIIDYNNCLSKLDKNYIEIDEDHELYSSEKYGIEISEEKEKIPILTQKKEKLTSDMDPLIEAIATEDQRDESVFFLIDTLDMAEEIEKESNEQKIITEPNTSLVVPQTPQQVFEPKINLEIIGMEDFNLPFNIQGSARRMNELTEKVIFETFESHLRKLLESSPEEKTATIPKEEQPPTKTKIQFTGLSEEVKKIKAKKSDIPPPPIPQSITPQIIEAEIKLDEITDISPEISQHELEVESESFVVKDELPRIPDLGEDKIALTEIVTDEKPIVKTTQEIKSVSEQLTQVKPPIDELITPQKTTMISAKLLEAATEAWKLTGKGLFNFKDDGTREFLGYLQEVIVFDNNQLGFTLVSENIANQKIIDKIFDQIKPLWVSEELMESPTKRKLFVIQEVVDALQIERDIALHISKLQEFANFKNINYPIEENLSQQEILSLVPLNKIKIKRGSIICEIEDLLSPRPYRTAPWQDKFEDEEAGTPLQKDCYYNHGVKIGKIISSVKHPLLGQLLLIDTEEPDQSLIDYLVDRLEIQEKDYKEKVWLAKYLIAKQLRIPEGDALKPKTLINYSLQRGFPILPNEILNAFRVFISGGSISTVKRNKVTLKNSARVYYPSEVIPIDCLRVRSTQGRHIGTCLGVSLAEKPVLLVSERLSREIVQLFTTAQVEKEVMSDISDSVIGSIGVELKDSLCPHNILKTLIVGRKIQTLTEYGYFLSKMNITGIDLSRIQVVEKGTIYIATLDTFTGTNIFEK